MIIFLGSQKVSRPFLLDFLKFSLSKAEVGEWSSIISIPLHLLIDLSTLLHSPFYQLLALANGDRIKDKQRSRNSYVVDMDKKVAAEKILEELQSHHGKIMRQVLML